MPMQRARRLASAVVVASLGVAGLSGCQTAPSVAAYLGPLGTVTESRVQAVWDDAHDALAQQAKGKPVTVPVTRTQIVQTLVLDKVFDQVAAAHGLTANTDQIDQIASGLKVPASTQFVQLFAHWNSLYAQLQAAAQNAPEPSDADLKAVFDALHSNGVISADETFEQFKASLSSGDNSNDQLLRSATATRDEITQVVRPLHIKVNPRYQPLSLSLLTINTQSGAQKDLISVPLGTNDAPAPVDSAAS